MLKALMQTSFSFPGQTGFYRGKVRDVYSVGERLVMIASDRISAFDHILPRGIPYKGQVLNLIAAHFLRATEDIIPNWLTGVPDPNVSIGLACEPFRVEMVIRGYLAGHAWRIYRSGGREICGVRMPDGMKEGDRFPQPIITPATKAEEGHDEDISSTEIVTQGIVSEEDYREMERATFALFERGSTMAREQGLILVDTKYEFGKKDGQVMVIDEIHTPDSSRFYYLDTYDEIQKTGGKQRQLSKEFVREWLMERAFQGKDGQEMPEMPDDFVELVSRRYIELYEKVTGQPFVRESTPDIEARIRKNVLRALTNQDL